MNNAEKMKKRAEKLKNPTPILLPSGSWRCQATVNGERLSFINDDPSIAHAQALAAKANLIRRKKAPQAMTVGEAIDKYIENKDAVLSPSTVHGYKKIRRNTMQDLMNLSLAQLTREHVQRSVNAMAKEKSPKYIRNAHGLLSAVLADFLPDMVLRTTLPQKKKIEIEIPSSDDISKIMLASKGTEMELPILLALWLGLRVSEIRGIAWSSIKDGVLHVRQAIVDGENGPVLKGTKTYSGDRKIKIPEYVQALIDKRPKNVEFLIPLSHRAIYGRFRRLCNKHNVPHYRFHDLRHANASVMLALHVPDKYAMERMGHATNNMLKSVYQHTMQEKQVEVTQSIDNYFIERLHTGLHTE